MVIAALIGQAKSDAITIVLPERSSFDTSLLIAATAGPLSVSFIFYFVCGVWARAEAFGSMFMLIGASVVACGGEKIVIRRPQFVMALFVCVLLAPPILSAAEISTKPFREAAVGIEQIPFKNEADTVSQDWNYRFGRPLTIIAGDSKTAGPLAAYMHPRPSVLIDGSTAKSPWLTDKQIRQEGALVVWRIRDARKSEPSPALVRTLVVYHAERLSALRIKTPFDRYVPPVLMGRAIIRPSVSFGAERDNGVSK